MLSNESEVFLVHVSHDFQSLNGWSGFEPAVQSRTRVEPEARFDQQRNIHLGRQLGARMEVVSEQRTESSDEDTVILKQKSSHWWYQPCWSVLLCCVSWVRLCLVAVQLAASLKRSEDRKQNEMKLPGM